MPGVDPLATDVRFASVSEVGDPKGTVWIKTLRHSCEAIGRSYQRVGVPSSSTAERSTEHAWAISSWTPVELKSPICLKVSVISKRHRYVDCDVPECVVEFAKKYAMRSVPKTFVRSGGVS